MLHVERRHDHVAFAALHCCLPRTNSSRHSCGDVWRARCRRPSRGPHSPWPRHQREVERPIAWWNAKPEYAILLQSPVAPTAPASTKTPFQSRRSDCGRFLIFGLKLVGQPRNSTTEGADRSLVALADDQSGTTGALLRWRPPEPDWRLSPHLRSSKSCGLVGRQGFGLDWCCSYLS